MRPNLIVIASMVVILATNIALDVSTDIPMLIRWTVAVVLGLVVSFTLTKLSKRRQQTLTNGTSGRP